MAENLNSGFGIRRYHGPLYEAEITGSIYDYNPTKIFRLFADDEGFYTWFDLQTQCPVADKMYSLRAAVDWLYFCFPRARVVEFGSRTITMPSSSFPNSHYPSPPFPSTTIPYLSPASPASPDLSKKAKAKPPAAKLYLPGKRKIEL